MNVGQTLVSVNWYKLALRHTLATGPARAGPPWRSERLLRSAHPEVGVVAPALAPGDGHLVDLVWIFLFPLLYLI